jgi:hypothetical protein
MFVPVTLVGLGLLLFRYGGAGLSARSRQRLVTSRSA